MQKGFVPILILVIIIIAAALGGAYYLGSQQATTGLPILSKPTPTPTLSPTSTPDPTANWKILNTEKCGFSLKYPNNWAARTEPLKPPPGVVGSYSRMPGTDAESEIFCLWLYVPLPGIDYNDYLRTTDDDFFIYVNRKLKGSRRLYIVLNSLDDFIKTYSAYSGYSSQVSNIQDKNFNSLKGKYYEDKGSDSNDHHFNFIFERGSYIYQIDWRKRTNDNYKKEVELIINSIKF